MSTSSAPGPASADHVPASADVVVVGAGLSGLAVARDLTRQGLHVVVLEARDDVGGRTRSHRTADGHRLDLGASWFWPGEERVAALVADLGIATFPQHLAGNASYHAPDGVQRLDGNPLDTPSRRFTHGADSLARGLAATLPPGTLHLATAVNAVAVDHNHLVVAHATGSIDADHVVLAVPPSLAVSRIEFSPTLPDDVAALAAATPVWMGDITKVVATFDRPFWRDHGWSGSAMSHLGPLREIHDLSGPDGHPAALFGFAPSAAGAVTPDAVVAQLTTIFGPEAAHPVEVVVLDWAAEPWTRPATATTSAPAQQTYGHRRYADADMGGRLHWSSTETANRSPGHLEGGLVAAARTTAAILATLDTT